MNKRAKAKPKAKRAKAKPKAKRAKAKPKPKRARSVKVERARKKAPKRDAYGRFLPRDARGIVPRLPPLRDKRGRYIGGSVKLTTPEQRAQFERIIDTIARIEILKSEPFFETRVKRALAQLAIVERIREAKAGQDAYLDRMRETLAKRAEIVEAITTSPKHLADYSREELVAAFGDWYNTEDFYEWIELSVYG